MRGSTSSRWGIGIAMAMAAACSDDSSGPPSPLDGGSADGGALCEEALRLAGKCPTLDGYGIFEGTGATQSPAAGVHP